MDPVLQEIVRRVVSRLNPERIYLFGSRARGDATQESDYDLLVVVREPKVPTRRLEMEACDALWGVQASVDLLVWSEAEFERRKSARASLPATVLREGLLLYAA